MGRDSRSRIWRRRNRTRATFPFDQPQHEPSTPAQPASEGFVRGEQPAGGPPAATSAVDADEAAASFEEGVCKVTLPKVAAERYEEIEFEPA